MVEQGLSQLCGESHRRLGREELGRDGGHQPYYRQRQQTEPHAPDMGRVSPACAPRIDATVDDAGHDQGHQQLEEGLQQLEQRRQDGLLLVIAQILH